MPTIWSAEDVLTVPLGALFRKGDDWTIFAVENGLARSTSVKIGHRNSRLAEVLSGVAPETQVILHPSDKISDGARVVSRVTR